MSLHQDFHGEPPMKIEQLDVFHVGNCFFSEKKNGGIKIYKKSDLKINDHSKQMKSKPFHVQQCFTKSSKAYPPVNIKLLKMAQSK